MTERRKEELHPRQVRIGIMGAIGSGKSTLSRELAARVGITAVEEDYPENPYLPLFYKDQKRFSFKSQTWFLVQKMRQLASLGPGSGVIDPDDEMDKCFAEAQYRMGYMTNNEWELYQAQRRSLREVWTIPPTDMFVLVDAPLEVLKTRIRERKRPYELLMLAQFPEYLTVLQETLNEWVEERKRQKLVVRIDTANNDLGSDKTEIDFLEQSVINLLLQKTK